MRTIYLLMVFIVSAAAQTLVPDINIDANRMDSSKKKDIQELKTTIESYIYDNSFSNNDYDFKIPFKIQLFVESVDENSAETNYSCQAFFTNGGDQRYVETGWRFPFSKGTAIFRSGIYDPIGSVIDFYGYLICASELDGIELNGGSTLFSQAQDMIQLAQLSKYSNAWNSKQTALNEITSNFRLRRARLLLNQCFWALEDSQPDDARNSLADALKLLDENIYLKNKDKYTRIFIESHYQDCEYLCKAFQDTFFIPDFRKLMPGYDTYFNHITEAYK